MHFDVRIDDELHSCQANAIIGNERIGESLFGVSNIDHHFGFWPLEFLQACALNLERKQAFVDVSHITFGAANGDFLTVDFSISSAASNGSQDLIAQYNKFRDISRIFMEN